MKKIVLFLIILLVSQAMFASWSFGVEGGPDYNITNRNTGWAGDVVWNKRWGFNAGINAEYSFNDWFALKSGFTVMSKNYNMQRTSMYSWNVYTEYKDLYLCLPLISDFSFGGSALRGHAFAGGYLGYWLLENRKGLSMDPVRGSSADELVAFDEKHSFSDSDSRFNAGLLCGWGVSYCFSKAWALNLNAYMYYDLTSYVKQLSSIVKEYRYNSTFVMSLGLTYSLGGASK